MQSRGVCQADIRAAWFSLFGWKSGIEPLERAGERIVENCDAHIEEGLHGPSIPSHLLLLDHAL